MHYFMRIRIKQSSTGKYGCFSVGLCFDTVPCSKSYNAVVFLYRLSLQGFMTCNTKRREKKKMKITIIILYLLSVKLWMLSCGGRLLP